MASEEFALTTNRQSAAASRASAGIDAGTEGRSAITCRFLDKLTLATLLAPVTEEQFRMRYWEQLPWMVSRNNPDFYGDLLTLQDFDREIASSPAYVKTAEAKSKKNVRNEGETASGLERTLADMRGGATLVLD